MSVRILTLILVALILLLQYSLWMGKGSWLQVWELNQKIEKQRELNNRLQARNSAMYAEVKDLKQGYDAIEERARSELGMIKEDEVFFQVLNDEMPGSTTKPNSLHQPEQLKHDSKNNQR